MVNKQWLISKGKFNHGMAKLWLTWRAKTEIEEKTFQSENDSTKKNTIKQFTIIYCHRRTVMLMLLLLVMMKVLHLLLLLKLLFLDSDSALTSVST
jgi:hypothetical protein